MCRDCRARRRRPSEAFDRLVKWQNEYTDKCNADESDTQTAIASKLEIYAVRFCLLLAVADWATGAKKKKAIDTATVERSIRLTEYFRVTAAKVQHAATMSNEGVFLSLFHFTLDWSSGTTKRKRSMKPLALRFPAASLTAAKVQCIIGEDSLTDVQLAVMSELPDKFTTAEGVAIASKNGMPERTFKRFLREKRGVYGFTLSRSGVSKGMSPFGILGIFLALSQTMRLEKFPNMLRNFPHGCNFRAWQHGWNCSPNEGRRAVHHCNRYSGTPRKNIDFIISNWKPQNGLM